MLALLVVFVALPIIMSFVIAFLDYNPLRQEGNVFVGFDNFLRLFRDDTFKKAFGNTIVFVGVCCVVNICVSLLIAYLLAMLRQARWRNLFRVLFFMPCVAPLSAIAVVWMRSILNTKGGLINMAIGALGIAPINWLGNAATLLPSIIMLSLWADLGYNIVLFIAGIEGIPSTYYDAAEIDGANAWQRFFQITIPLLNKTLTFVLIMTVISFFQAFAQFVIMAPNGGAGRAGYVLSNYIYFTGFTGKNMGYASAISLILFGMILVITMIQKHATKADWGY